MILFVACISWLVLMAPLASSKFITTNEEAGIAPTSNLDFAMESERLTKSHGFTDDDVIVKESESSGTLREFASISESSVPFNRFMFNQERIAVERELNACEENDRICLLRQHSRLNRIEQFQTELLKKLNMKEPPNVSKSDLPSQFTIASLKKRYGIDRLERRSQINSRKMKMETKEVISVAKLIPIEKGGDNEGGCYFELTEEEKKFKARKASLWLYIQPNTTRDVPSIAHITLINFKMAENGSYIPITGPRRRIRITSDRGHWQRIEITDYINRILSNRNDSQRMRVIPDQDAQDIVVTIDEDQFAFKPYMHLTLVEDTALLKRQKRSSGSITQPECYGKNANIHCCMFDLELSFKQVGWDWVLYPDSYNAKYCLGECNHFHTRDTMRGRMVAHASSFLTEDEFKSCCAPENMLPISILYHDSQNNIIFTNIKEMVISGCRCV